MKPTVGRTLHIYTKCNGFERGPLVGQVIGVNAQKTIMHVRVLEVGMADREETFSMDSLGLGHTQRNGLIANRWCWPPKETE